MTVIEAIEERIKEGQRRWEARAYDENGFYDPQGAMTDAELFGLTDDEKRRAHIQRPPVARGVETITSVAAMQLRAGSLFSEQIQGKIGGYRVEMDRSVHPAEFHITTWKNGRTYRRTPADAL